jgi:hypothetical protein
VSGVLPETERERQLRQLASRLLTHPDPSGPVTVDLLPVGYPEDLPPELVDRTELRFLGSLVRRRAGALVGAELVFDGAGAREAVIENYETVMVGLGWERLDRPGPRGGGFEPEGFGAMSSLVDRKKSAALFLHAMDREGGATELRVRYDAEHALEMIANMGHGMPPEASMLPRLKPPPGVKLHPQGGGGGGGRWKSEAWAQTEMAPMELEAHFAKQLEAAGWGRMSGSADETFAWSSWLIPDSGEWRGVLLGWPRFRAGDRYRWRPS